MCILTLFFIPGPAGVDGTAQVLGADGRGEVAVAGGRHQEHLQGDLRHLAQGYVRVPAVLLSRKTESMEAVDI